VANIKKTNKIAVFVFEVLFRIGRGDIFRILILGHLKIFDLKI